MIEYHIHEHDVKDIENAVDIACCSLMGELGKIESIINNYGVNTSNCFSPMLSLLFDFYDLRSWDLVSEKATKRINFLGSLLYKVRNRNGDNLLLDEIEYALLNGALNLCSALIKKQFCYLESYIAWGHSKEKERFSSKIVQAIESSLTPDTDQELRRTVSDKYSRHANAMDTKSKLSDAGLMHCFQKEKPH